MLFYFECQKCKQRTPLLREDELPKDPLVCGKKSCKVKPAPKVIKHATNTYLLHCTRCARTSQIQSEATYDKYKASKPSCIKCNQTDKVIFIPPILNRDPKFLERRKTPGILAPSDVEVIEKHHKRKLEQLIPPIPKKKQKTTLVILGAPKDSPLEQLMEEDSLGSKFATVEANYQAHITFQKQFDEQHGKFKDSQNPLKSKSHKGRVVEFSWYQKEYKKKKHETIGGTKYPKLNKSSPTIVNSAKVMSRDTTWDYRMMGPNSFLRRLCSVLYTIEFKKGASLNPVEVQAMWAAGSLFISSNNYSFSEKLASCLDEEGSLKELIKEIKLPGASSGTYKGVWRNYGMQHRAKVQQYQKDFVAAKYPNYFQYKWNFVFDDLVCAVAGETKKGDDVEVESIVVKNSELGYTHWSTEAKVTSNKVYIVVPKHKPPNKDEKFKKKDVHAEQLFFPILLKIKERLNKFQPAFFGGVKTPCRTCAMVLKEAQKRLGDKVVLPTDAFGHYWKASGKHVKNPKFYPSDETLVFANDTSSNNVFNTEMPGSPEHD